MTRSVMTLVMGMMLLLSFAASARADWPVTSYPEYRGKILDAETKEPIEGAVAVVYYDRDMLIGGPGGPGSYIFHAKERLTDEKGEFTFPSYTSLHLISEGGCASFIFFKPGYMAISGLVYTLDDTGLYVSLDQYLSTGPVGEEIEIRYATRKGAVVPWVGPAGIVELRKAKTREEKWRSSLVSTSSMGARELPILYKAIEEAEKKLKAEGIQ